MNKYIQYAKVLKIIAVDQGNFKTILFREFKGDSNMKEAYGILIKAVNNYDKIIEIGQSIIEKNGNDVIGNLQLFVILVIEQFFSRKKKIEGGGQLKKVIMENKEFISSLLDLTEENTEGLIKQDVYIRVIQRTCDQEQSNHIQIMKNMGLTIQEVSKLPNVMSTAKPDDDIWNLYSLSYSSYQAALEQDCSVLESSEYLIQSKSSSLPVYFLFTNVVNHLPFTKFDVLDCCSAPGNMTIQAAEYLGNRGKVYAFEKDQQRFQLLQERVIKYKFHKQIQSRHSDVLSINLSIGYEKVMYCVANPSCSGTGMLNHIFFDDEQKAICSKSNVCNDHDFQERTRQIFNQYDSGMKSRIEGLGLLQLRILNKLASIPSLKAISYSTCSIHEQENEDVVARFMQIHPQFILLNVAPNWKTRGFKTDLLKEGDKCIRVNPFDGKQDGFFVAILIKKSEILQ